MKTKDLVPLSQKRFKEDKLGRRHCHDVNCSKQELKKYRYVES